MNMPNKLTVFRVVLTPLFMGAMLWTTWKPHYFVAVALFSIASITDYIDGSMARKSGQVTTFGKFLDPLADKILTTAALLCLLTVNYCSVWVLMLVISRDFLVSSVRLVAMGEGKVVAANMWGKVKTSLQMVFIIAVIAMMGFQEAGLFTAVPMKLVSNILMWALAAITVLSGVIYVRDNREFINTTK